MLFAQNLRLLVPLVIGLAVGGAGVAMFRESRPGEKGRSEKLEVERKPDQRAAYDAAQRRRRDEAEKDLTTIGLTLPPDGDMFNEAVL